MVNVSDAEDLQVDSSFEVFISHRGDLAFVSGREAFEQELLVRLQERYNDIVGGLDPEQTRKLLEQEARRVAKEMDRVAEVARFSVEQDDEVANKINVTVIYDTGDELTFEVD